MFALPQPPFWENVIVFVSGVFHMFTVADASLNPTGCWLKSIVVTLVAQALA